MVWLTRQKSINMCSLLCEESVILSANHSKQVPNQRVHFVTHIIETGKIWRRVQIEICDCSIGNNQAECCCCSFLATTKSNPAKGTKCWRCHMMPTTTDDFITPVQIRIFPRVLMLNKLLLAFAYSKRYLKPEGREKFPYKIFWLCV